MVLVLSASEDCLAPACQPEAGVEDQTSGDDGLSVIAGALIAHPLWDVRGKQPPLVTHAMLLCCAHEEVVLLFCPVAHGLCRQLANLGICHSVKDGQD